MLGKNVPETTTLTAETAAPATSEQKQKLILNFAAALEGAGLDQNFARCFIESGQDKFILLIHKAREYYKGLKRAIDYGISGQWRTKLEVEEKGVISEEDPRNLIRMLREEPYCEIDYISDTTHFYFCDPDIEANSFACGKMEEVCAILGVSSKLIGLVYRNYRADDILHGLVSESEAKHERRQIITNLLPFPEIIWDIPGQSWDEVKKQDVEVNRDALRKLCLKSKAALLSSASHKA